MLEPGLISKPLKKFIEKMNKQKQTDANKSIADFSQEMETIIFKAIKKATITLPPGSIQVVGSPSAQANAAPITLNNTIK